MSSTAPLVFHASLPPEEAARADLYALLARLFYSAPDAALLSALAASAPPDETTALGQAWQGLKRAAALATPEGVRAEYEDTFIGTGRARISLYGTHYLSETWRELTLADLRARLAGLGLARNPEAAEPEDHLAGLCDVMQMLVRRGGSDREIAVQKEFFTTYLAPWYARLVLDIEACDLAFYRSAAQFLRAYLDLEQQGFCIED
ncbi:MAG: molecular chaperone TorD family protein [Burkholderiales bacterium]|nr:molecular chaperone TorD family protein [Burkholderiales bacterium]